ncbi:hypothetical protein [Ramlibacter sp. WS9]|uniref:hypothetical protein n=1 Tax=Ramlibacter sp. WS9 TaxID=1882741 RepID=UPI0011432A72|nr:hypothetical protein [Ramlibacter sp. WS9]ROZ75382.1 hypothetical protein EEB15_15615 [Ramlibacter sp. WS9]
MMLKHHFTFEKDWRFAPAAFWVHIPTPNTEREFAPPAPEPIPHKGYAFLHVEVEGVDLQFSAPAQLDHFIEVLRRKPLPTSRQLSSKRGLALGPNGHWLSRLPAKLKAPRAREKMVRVLREVRAKVVGTGSDIAFNTSAFM